MIYEINKISKILSPNDIGLTRSHQSCILIPAKDEVVAFFPDLGNSIQNPRISLDFHDENGKIWIFNYIHYNDKIIKGGFKNEFRLTGVKAYMVEKKLNPGDTIILERDKEGILHIFFERKNQKVAQINTEKTVLKLTGGWRVIKY